MPDPLKDLSDLRKLFPELESYVPDPAESTEETKDTGLSAKEKSAMKLYVSRDKKQRAGKTVTLVEGFAGPEGEALKMLAALKALCATGGVYKDDTIQLQGDHVRKVMDWLAKQGYKQVKQKGG
jgi:translation initiation factor 1